MPDDLYRIAKEITDEVMGEGAYARLNSGNPDPGVQAAIGRSREELLALRRDRFEEWWEAHGQEVAQADREMVWALCRDAWYASRRLAFSEAEGRGERG